MRQAKILKDERGAVLILVAALLIMLIVLAALAIDIGQLFIADQKTQDDCDASALAGAFELWKNYEDGAGAAKSAAQLAADQTASGNNESNSEWRVYSAPACGDGDSGVAVSFPVGTLTDAGGKSITVDDGEAITVEGFMPVDYAFAPVIGISSSVAKASATAVVVSGFPSDLPIPEGVSSLAIFGGIDPDDPTKTIPPIEFGELYTMHVPSHKTGFLGPGNYQSLRLTPEDSGAKDYENRLAGDGDPAFITLEPGATVETETGKKPSATYDGIISRLADETDSRFEMVNKNPKTTDGSNPDAWNNWLASDDVTGVYAPTTRIVIVPIIKDEIDIMGHKTVEVVGLAGFFIESVTKDGVLTGRFLQGVLLGGEYHWDIPTGSPDNPRIMKAVRLIS